MTDFVESATIWSEHDNEVTLRAGLNHQSWSLDDSASEARLVAADKHSSELETSKTGDRFDLEWSFGWGHKLVQLNLEGPIGRLSRESSRQRQLRDGVWIVYDHALVFIDGQDWRLLLSRDQLAVFDAQLECFRPLPQEPDQRLPIPSDLYDDDTRFI